MNPPTGITLQYHCPDGLLMPLYVHSRPSDCKQLTIASWCICAPMTAGHAGKIAVSLQGVSWVTGVGHCRSKGCTRATSLTICRSIGGRTTAGACREDTGTTFLVTTIHAHVIKCRLKGMQVYTCTVMQTNPHTI